MPQSLGLQILTKVCGDQSRSAIRQQPGPIRQRGLIHTRSLTSRLDHLGEVSSTHGRLKPPGQDSSAKVIQDRDQIVPAPVSKEGVGGTAGPASGIQTGLESDLAPRTGPDPGNSIVVSREVPTGGELPGNGPLRVYGVGILGLPNPEGRRTDPGGSTPEFSGRIGVSNPDHENQPAVANGCDLSSGQKLGLVLSDLGPG